MTAREEFENAIIIKLGIPENVFLLKEIQDKTKIIQDHQFAEFIGKLSKKRDYHKADEKLDAVVKEYEDGLKLKLHAEVPEKAEILKCKLVAMFRQIEDLFSPNHGTYDKAIVRRFDSPTNYIKKAKISNNNFWTIKDIQVVDKIGLNRCYTIYNSSYAKLDKVIEDEMKILITKSFFIGDTKQINYAMNKLQIKGMR